MTDHEGLSHSQLNLIAGLDRARAWRQGGSVRYLVAELSADGAAGTCAEGPAFNLALAIDVSGSMAGDKIEAARRAARAIADALSPRDRLSIVAFDNTTELLLDARPMDADGRAAAYAAIAGLEAGARPCSMAGCSRRSAWPVPWQRRPRHRTACSCSPTVTPTPV
jgi:Ca-activated chloride channel homolog